MRRSHCASQRSLRRNTAQMRFGAYFREGRARSTYGSIGVVGTSRDRNPKAANFGCTAAWHIQHGTALPAETCARMLADVVFHSTIVGGLSDNIIE